MARFYKPDRAEFDKDFIFQPDWDLAEAIIGKKDKENADRMAAMNLLKNVSFEYDTGADEILALEEKKKWDDITNALSLQINTSPEEYMSHMAAINQYANKLQESRDFGNIKKMTTNLAALNELREKAKAEDGSTVEMYDNLIEDYYNRVGGRGATTEMFKQAFFADKGYASKDFLESEQFKALKENTRKGLKLNTNGQFVYTSGQKVSSIDEKRVRDAYKKFIEENPQLKGLFAIKDKYGNETKKFLDEQGEVSFEKGSFIGDAMFSNDIYAHKTSEQILDYQGKNDYTYARFMKEEVNHQPMTGNLIVDELILQNNNLHAEQYVAVQETIAKMGLTGRLSSASNIKTFEQLRQVISSNNQVNLTTKEKQKLWNLQKEFTTKYTAGYDALYKNNTPEDVVLAFYSSNEKFLKKGVLDNSIKIKSGKGTMPVGQGKGPNNDKFLVNKPATYRSPFGNFTYKLEDGSPQQLVGKHFDMGNGNFAKIRNVTYMENSQVPVLRQNAGGPNWKGEDMRNIDMTFNLEYVVDIYDKDGTKLGSSDDADNMLQPMIVRVATDLKESGPGAGVRR